MKLRTVLICAVICLSGCAKKSKLEEPVTRYELIKILQARDAGHKVYRTAVADSFKDVYERLGEDK